MSDPAPPRIDPPLTDGEWKTLRDLLRSRAVTSEERSALRRILVHHGRLGSLVRMSPIPREEP